jgi:subtilisin family serine protease
VAIAIIDSGLQLDHPDLSGKLWINPGDIAGNSLDDDNNGYVDDVNGWDFVNDDNDPSDDEGHGTQVAGVAAASTDNAIGISGLPHHAGQGDAIQWGG